ncbi:MAG: M28 family peptidase [Balneolaceae bacterium]
MKNNILPLLLFITLIGCSGPKETVTIPAPSIYDFTNTINLEGLKADLTILSHDSLEGRNTGSVGEAKAAKFLADKYERLGLTPVGDNGTYFQKVEIAQPITDSYTYTVSSLDGNIVSTTTHSGDEIGSFRTWRAGGKEQSGEIVFVGSASKTDTTNHFFENAEGKWLLAFYDRANYPALQQEISEKKALGAILILDTEEIEYLEQAKEEQDSFGQAGRMSLSYLEENSSTQSTINIINPAFAAQLLGVDDVENLNNLGARILAEPKGFVASETGFKLSHLQKARSQSLETKNIVALIEGSNPDLKNEVIVLSSHYDHVGIGSPDSTGDTIYNGADDDGSGTIGILHTAQALMSAKKAGAGPERSVLILHVTGEEKGLLGSRYYSDHPIYDIEKTVANLNIDMIGRRDFENPENGDYIYIIGGKIISSGLNSMLEEANLESVNITLSDRYNDLEDPNQFYRRSDHWNFGRLGVPFVFFFNGVHEDYHRPSDEVEKIDFNALTKRSQLIFTTTAKIANAAERPMVDNQQFIKKTQELPR